MSPSESADLRVPDGSRSSHLAHHPQRSGARAGCRREPRRLDHRRQRSGSSRRHGDDPQHRQRCDPGGHDQRGRRLPGGGAAARHLRDHRGTSGIRTTAAPARAEHRRQPDGEPADGRSGGRGKRHGDDPGADGGGGEIAALFGGGLEAALDPAGAQPKHSRAGADPAWVGARQLAHRGVVHHDQVRRRRRSAQRVHLPGRRRRARRRDLGKHAGQRHAGSGAGIRRPAQQLRQPVPARR